MTMFTSTRGQSRGVVRAAGRAPLMEGLEVRRLMAAEPPVPMIDADGVLQVAGTNKNDAIVLSMDNAQIVVDLNGVPYSFPLASVTGGAVVVHGRNGADDISVDGGLAGVTLSMYGGNGHDRLAGGAGGEYLYGGNGRDRLEGGDGADHLYGGNGRDDLDAGDGADMLFGERGVDSLTGGLGADHFTDKADQVVDMAVDDGDTGDLLPAATEAAKK